MGALAEITKRVPIHSQAIFESENSYPQEYPNPCPFLTPENLGCPRSTPYVYVEY